MQRLEFRAWRESHLEPFARFTADPRVMQYFATPLKSEASRARGRCHAPAERHGCVQVTSPSQSPQLQITRSRVNEVRSDSSPALSSLIRMRCVPG